MKTSHEAANLKGPLAGDAIVQVVVQGLCDTPPMYPSWKEQSAKEEQNSKKPTTGSIGEIFQTLEM